METVYLIENKKYHIIDNEYKYYYLCLNNEFINLDIKIDEIGEILKFSHTFEHFDKEEFNKLFSDELVEKNFFKINNDKKELLIKYFNEKHFSKSESCLS